ncbi:MAG TPA: hopanoid-associated sugar epimerase [Dongiaceae bacterium]|jgi:dihydroflavonol-4-reductase|nr:hopanoid-associated sugar epimerase [Dongiaceae bacterium]
MTALVTGASGFVGSAVARALLRRGETVRAFVRPSSDRRNLEDIKIEVEVGDLRDRASVERAAKGCDTVFHVAADYRLWVPKPEDMFHANVDGTRNVMEAAANAGARRIVYTSSVATLGLPQGSEPANEETPVKQSDIISPYKQSKFAAEALVKRMVKEQGLPAVIVHPSTPIGPRDVKPTPTGKIVVEAAKGRMPAFVDTGLNVVHVDDVAEGHLLALERGEIGGQYILGAENLSLAQILATVAEIVHRPAPKWKLPHDMVMPIAYLAEFWAWLTGREPFVTRDGVRLARKMMYFSSDHAKQALGYRPRPAKIAIADAVSWFSQHGYL